MLVCRVNTKKHRLIDLGSFVEKEITKLVGPLYRNDKADISAVFAFYLLRVVELAFNGILRNNMSCMHDNQFRESDKKEVLIKFSYTPNMKHTNVKVEIENYGSL